MHVVVDEERCIGSGQCALAASQVFDQREEDGIVSLLVAEPPAELAVGVTMAVNLCPAQAIGLLPIEAGSGDSDPNEVIQQGR